MELRQLKYFLAVAEEGLIVRAAEKLAITQPPLSQQMKLLEDEMGTPLFARDRKRIRLTESGKILERRARQMMEILRRAKDEIRESSEGVSGVLSVGVVASYGGALLPRRIEEFHASYPKVTFQLRQGSTQKIIELARAGLIELGFVHLPADEENFDSLPLPEEELILADAGSLLPAESGAEPVSSLNEKPLLIHERYRPAIVEACRQNGFEPLIFCASDDIYPLLYWSAAGLGVAIVPESAMRFAAGERLFFHRISGSPLTTTGAVIQAKGQPLSAAARNFLRLFRDDKVTRREHT